jgi:hypothetical protein
VVPSWKVTLPVTVPVPGAITLTLDDRVTVCPVTDEFGVAVNVVVVAVRFTTWVMAGDVLGAKPLLPA